MVAPLVGAWIEIDRVSEIATSFVSLPSWERGLKYVDHPELICLCSRSPRGSVD